jgi:hypothetical protein
MFPKFAYVRSPALLKACRELACQNCEIRDGTVVAAHSNQARHGKGRGIKASDIFVAALCFHCHSKIDQGKDLSQDEREAIWQTAYVRTMQLLVKTGLWPRKLPLPGAL